MSALGKRGVGIAVWFGLIAAVSEGGVSQAAAEPASIIIASGRAGGLYHPVAGAICSLVNENTSRHDITCTVEFGLGSVSNIEHLRDGEVTLAIAQSDTHRDAVHGIGPFDEAGPFEDLRSVLALYVEQVTVLARKDRDINVFADLKGKTIYLPPPEAGGRVLMEQLMDAEGWPADAVDVVSTHVAPNVAQALCDGEFDAFSLTVGHPSPLIKEATTTCDAVLVEVSDPAVHAVIDAEPLYARSTIPGKTYRGNRQDVPGLGLVATLVTTAQTSPDTIYEVTKAFFEGVDRLRSESFLFSSLTTEQMAKVGLIAPLHEGAARYYSQADLE